MQQARPGQIIVLVSAVVLVVTSFLDLSADDKSAWSDFGLFTWPALFGILAAAAIAAQAFGHVRLPGPILTFRPVQLLVVLAFTGFMILLGLAIAGKDLSGAFWAYLAASVGLLVGLVIEDRAAPDAGTAAISTAPTPF